MGDTIQDVVQQQQQSTEEKTELCIGIKPSVNEKMGTSKQELVVRTYKIAQLEERSELCISKIGVKSPVDEEMGATKVITPDMMNALQSENDAKLCTGYNSVTLPTTIVHEMVKILTPSTEKTLRVSEQH